LSLDNVRDTRWPTYRHKLDMLSAIKSLWVRNLTRGCALVMLNYLKAGMDTAVPMHMRYPKKEIAVDGLHYSALHDQPTYQRVVLN